MIIRAAVSNGSARPTGFERVLEVVGAGCHDDAGLTQGLHGREAARHRGLVVASLEEQVRVGERDDADPGRGDLLGHAALHVLGLDAEADAVRGRHRMGETSGDDPFGQVLERQHRRVQRLVGVEVDGQAGVGGDVEEQLVRRRGIVLQVRAAADQVDAHRDGLGHERAHLRAGTADDRPAAQRHDLDVDQAAQAVAQRRQRLDRGEAVLDRQVGMCPDGGDPLLSIVSAARSARSAMSGTLRR